MIQEATDGVIVQRAYGDELYGDATRDTNRIVDVEAGLNASESGELSVRSPVEQLNVELGCRRKVGPVLCEELLEGNSGFSRYIKAINVTLRSLKLANSLLYAETPRTLLVCVADVVGIPYSACRHEIVVISAHVGSMSRLLLLGSGCGFGAANGREKVVVG